MDYDQVIEEIKRRAAQRRKEHPEIETELARLSELPRQLKSLGDYRTALEGNLYDSAPREAGATGTPR